MLKEKLDPKIIAATVGAFALAVVSLFLLFPGSISFGSKKKEEVKLDTVAIKKDAVKVAPKIEKKTPKAKLEAHVPIAVSAPVEIKVEEPKPVATQEAVKRIEAKLRLKKPQTPSQVNEYLPLVYWACREIGRLGQRDRALEWVEEGLGFSQDASFYAYGALLEYRQGRNGLAQAKAEQALIAPAYLDRRAVQLAHAVQALLQNPKDSASINLISSYE